MAFKDSWSLAFTNQKVAKYICEFIGTCILVLIIKLSVVNFSPPWPAICVGSGIAALIYTYGYVSNALFNPSLTLAFTIRDPEDWPRSDWCQITMYYITQFLGGITGGLLGWLLEPDSAFIYPSAFRGMEPDTDLMFRFTRAFVAEMIFTFILTTVLLHEATDDRQNGNQHCGMAVGMCVTVSIMCIGDISGCCLNSAVWLGTVFPALLATWTASSDDRGKSITTRSDTNAKGLDLSDAWIYWIAPFVGAALAASLFNAVFVRGSRKRNPTLEESVKRHMTIDEANQVVGGVCEMVASPEIMMEEPSQTMSTFVQCRE